jgi:hypothetical protein
MEQSTKIIIYVLVGLTIGLLVFGILSKGTGTKTDTSDTSNGTTKKPFNIWPLLFIAALVVIAWLWFRDKDKGKGLPMSTPDEVEEIVKERLVIKEGLKGYYDEDGKIQLAPGSVIFNDQRPFVPAGTGQEYYAREFTILDPDAFHEPQSRVIMVNLNRDKKLLQGGLYAYHEHTTLFEWLKHKSFLRKLPVSSPESEGLQLAQFAAEQDIDIGEIQKMRGLTRRQPTYGFEDRGYDYPETGMPLRGGDEETSEEDKGEEDQQGGFLGRYWPRRSSRPWRRRR